MGTATGCSEPGLPSAAILPENGPSPADRPGYSIYLADRSGVDVRRLTRGFAPAWSPDGNDIAFQGIAADGTVSGIFLMSVHSTGQRPLTGADTWLPRWSPDGRRIAYVACSPVPEDGPMPMCDLTINVIMADGGGAVALARISVSGTIPPPAWSPDGTRIAFVSGEGAGADLHVINTDGSGLTRLTSLGTVGAADWSPDGRMLAVAAAGSAYTVRADGSHLTRLTSAPDSLMVRHIEWSPGGDRIAYSLSLNPVVRETTDGSTLTIHVMNADGTSHSTVATNAHEPRWLPDGRSLSFSRWFTAEIWIVSADGGEPVRFLPGAMEGAWSRDGHRIAYVRHDR